MEVVPCLQIQYETEDHSYLTKNKRTIRHLQGMDEHIRYLALSPHRQKSILRHLWHENSENDRRIQANSSPLFPCKGIKKW